MNPVWLNILFKQKLFRIPDYQRWYAWQKNQLKDFWEDLINLSNNRWHYTWVLSLKEVPLKEIKEDDNEFWLLDDHSYKMYDIVDWQQRLTTCIIFIQSLVEVYRELEDNKNKKDNEIFLTDSLNLKEIIENFLFKQKPNWGNYRTYKFWYHTDNPSYQYMRYNILWEENPWNIDETFYTLNLKNAKFYFKAQLQELYKVEWLEGLQEIYKKISKKFLFNEYIIEDEFDVFVAFETMNNRWKNLSKLELLKNRLIYLTTLYWDDELDPAWRKDLRNKINESWKEVYHQLWRNEKKPLSDDDFLKAHWIMTFKYSRKKWDDYVNFLLNEYFTPKNIFNKVEKEIILDSPVEQNTDVDFSDNEIEDTNIEEENNIKLVAKLEPKQIEEYVNSLRTSAVHWFNTFYPYLANSDQLSDEIKEYIDKLNRIWMWYFRPLLMSIFKNILDNDDRIKILKKIERFIFINFRLNRALSNFWDSEFYNTARDLDRKEINTNEVIKRLTEKESFSFDDEWKFISKFFEDFMYKKFYTGNREWYYKWNWLQYFLYEYELDKMKVSWQKKVDWNLFIKNDKDKISIEHIFPQTPTNDYWQEYFSDVINTDKQYIYNGSLWNLLLLSSSINSSLQNDSYLDKKKPKYNQSNELVRMWYSNWSHSEIEVSQKYNNWTPNHILERWLDLLYFLEKRWDINLWDIEQKKKLLFL